MFGSRILCCLRSRPPLMWPCWQTESLTGEWYTVPFGRWARWPRSFRCPLENISVRRVTDRLQSQVSIKSLGRHSDCVVNHLLECFVLILSLFSPIQLRSSDKRGWSKNTVKTLTSREVSLDVCLVLPVQYEGCCLRLLWLKILELMALVADDQIPLGRLRNCDGLWWY